MAREGLMDDCGYKGFEECLCMNECMEETYIKALDDFEELIILHLNELVNASEWKFKKIISEISAELKK